MLNFCAVVSHLKYSACLDGKLRKWNGLTGELIKTYYGHTEGLQDLKISLDGSLLFTASDDHTMRLFQA